MEFLLAVQVPATWDELSEDERTAFYEEYAALRTEPGYLGGAELSAAAPSATVRVRDDRVLVTDGPFADAKEVFGGYYLFDLPALQDAVALAARIPAARIGGAVEVRQVAHRH